MALPQKAPTESPKAPALAAVPSPSAPPQLRKLKRGEMLFNEGDNSRAMYFLKNGMIRIFKKKAEGQIELDTIHSGSVLGELAFLDGNPRSASGEALTDCELVEISASTFAAVFSQTPDWLKILLKTIVGRLRTASTRIRQLESSSTAVDYSDKSGKRSTSYVFLSPLEVLKILSGLLLIASRYGKPAADGKGIELRMGLTGRYINQIMGVPVAKISTLVDVLCQSGVLAAREADTILTDIVFLEQLIAYLNDENLAEPSKRHDLPPRGFVIMNLMIKHLPRFKQDDTSGFTPVNIAEILGHEKREQGKDPFRMEEFQVLVDLGYATNVDMKSSSEAVTLIHADDFVKAFRFQRVCMGIRAVNEQKRK